MDYRDAKRRLEAAVASATGKRGASSRRSCLSLCSGRSLASAYATGQLLGRQPYVPVEEPCTASQPGLMQRSKKHSLFDHLVGAGEQRGRHVETKRLCSLEVDDNIETGRLLDRYFTGLGTLE
jgi:hypothetical protein